MIVFSDTVKLLLSIVGVEYEYCAVELEAETVTVHLLSFVSAFLQVTVVPEMVMVSPKYAVFDEWLQEPYRLLFAVTPKLIVNARLHAVFPSRIS